MHSDKADLRRGDDVVVMKFGGTSVEDSAAIRRLIGIVQEQAGCAASHSGQRAGSGYRSILEAGNTAAKGHLGSALATVEEHLRPP